MCSGLAAAFAVRPQAAPLSVRRSRVHGDQRSCTCGLSAHSRSTASNNQRSCTCIALVAVSAADWQLHSQYVRRSRVHGGGLAAAFAVSTSAGRASQRRPQVASAWQRPLSSQQVDSRPHLQYARRPRLSASAGRECMAISAGRQQASQLTADRRQCVRRSRVHGNQRTCTCVGGSECAADLSVGNNPLA